MKVFSTLLILLFINTAYARDIVLLDAKIYTGLDEQPLVGGIRIRDGKIIEVGKKIEIAGAIVASAHGGFVTAGLIDSGSTLGIEEVGLSTRAEDQKYEGDAMGAGFDPATAFNYLSSLIPSLTVEGVTHAFIRPEPGKDVLAGQGALVNLSQQNGSVYEGSRAVYVYLGEQGRELAGKYRAAALQRLLRALNEARLFDQNRKAHKSNRLQALGFPVADLEALVPVVAGEKRLALYIDRASEIQSVLEALDPFELKIVLIGAREAWKVPGSIRSRNIPVVLNALDNLPRNFDRLGARLDQPALLHEAGITFAFMSEDLLHAALSR